MFVRKFDSAIRLAGWPIRGLIVAGLCVLAGGLTACTSRPVGFASADPQGRLEAVKAAVRTKNRAAVPDLIRLLDADDPVIRLASIRALESLTGQTMGYNHADPAWRRAEAVQRWIAWERGPGQMSGKGLDSAMRGQLATQGGPSRSAPSERPDPSDTLSRTLDQNPR